MSLPFFFPSVTGSFPLPFNYGSLYPFFSFHGVNLPRFLSGTFSLNWLLFTLVFLDFDPVFFALVFSFVPHTF